ncbi:hypothetical protein B1H26_24160 [Amycolatopsis sp. BJA-103]|nr:hypothetical protein BKN51_20545 [Amycolatopsis sp. BJA-103]PNE16371.1 hypothetical protein B1H26_24160 [Amycolatopsis sp. BJA-103]
MDSVWVFGCGERMVSIGILVRVSRGPWCWFMVRRGRASTWVWRRVKRVPRELSMVVWKRVLPSGWIWMVMVRRRGSGTFWMGGGLIPFL